MEEALDLYLLDAAVHVTPKTYQWYDAKLHAFAGWMQQEGLELTTFKTPLLNRYLRDLQTRSSTRTGEPLSTHTIHGYAQVVLGFLRWAGEQGYAPPIGKFKLPKVKQIIIETFSANQIKQLLSVCAKEETEALAQRDRAMLYVLLDTGVRASELCGLRLPDLHLSENYLKVLGKGNKEREVGFGANTKYHLVKYLRRYRSAVDGVEEVFVNKRRQPLTIYGLDQMLYRLGDWAHIEGVRCSAHTFRHTYAVNFLLGGGDMYALSRSLGHTSVSTTEIYVRASKDRDLRRVNSSVADKLLTR